MSDDPKLPVVVNPTNENRRLVKLQLTQRIIVLYAQRVSAEEIAEQLGIERKRVYRCISEARKEWSAQNSALFDEIRERELVDLDLMERQAAQEFVQARDPEWLKVRLAIKVFRARLVGLIGRDTLPLQPQDGEMVVDLRFGDGKPT